MYNKFEFSDELGTYIKSLKRREEINFNVDLFSSMFNISYEEALAFLDRLVKSLIDESVICIRVNPNTLLNILECGTFKNQIETLKSDGGILDIRERIIKESDKLNVPNNVSVADRPIYAMGFPSEGFDDYIANGPGYWFGANSGCVIVLDKEKIKEGTTVTLGDSLKEENVYGTHLMNPFFNGAFDNFFETCSQFGGQEDFKLKNIFSKENEYLEYQIHGRSNHTTSIISEVVFSSEIDKKLEEKLTSMGIPFRYVKVKSKEQSNQVKF